MIKKICTMLLILCLFLSTAGYGQDKGPTAADNTFRKTCSGVVKDRFTQGSGSNLRNCLNVNTGENSTKVFILTNSTNISGAEDVAVGDQVEIEYEGNTNSDNPAIIQMTVHPLNPCLTSMVMVNGALYYDTGRESARSERNGDMDGKITSTVDGSETPAENNQSNFGTGYAYQYGESGTIEVLCDDKWTVFEQRWVEYTYDDSKNGVKFSFKYPEGWKLTEERPSNSDETQEGSSMSSGISFQFLNPDSDYDTDQYLIIASLIFPFEVDESLFESEPFETKNGLAATKFTRELDNRIYSYYIFGDGVTVPQYTAIATMSVTNYELLKHDMEAVTKTLKILTDE